LGLSNLPAISTHLIQYARFSMTIVRLQLGNARSQSTKKVSVSNGCGVQRGANGTNAQRAMYLRYRITAPELRDIGGDSNCARMVDVANTETYPYLRNCCYGTDV
jgi:beta-glucosidase-like glycosyl hydrolase